MILFHCTVIITDCLSRCNYYGVGIGTLTLSKVSWSSRQKFSKEGRKFSTVRHFRFCLLNTIIHKRKENVKYVKCKAMQFKMSREYSFSDRRAVFWGHRPVENPLVKTKFGQIWFQPGHLNIKRRHDFWTRSHHACISMLPKMSTFMSSENNLYLITWPAQLIFWANGTLNALIWQNILLWSKEPVNLSLKSVLPVGLSALGVIQWNGALYAVLSSQNALTLRFHCLTSHLYCSQMTWSFQWLLHIVNLFWNTFLWMVSEVACCLKFETITHLISHSRGNIFCKV